MFASFEGQYKNRPKVSLGGSVIKKTAHELIDSNQSAREERDLIRKKNICAIIIQRTVRGFLIRCKIHKHLRDCFNGRINTVPQHNADLEKWLKDLFRMLNLFYRINYNSNLLALCDMLVSNKDYQIVLQSWLSDTSEYENIVRISCFITSILKYLSNLKVRSSQIEFHKPIRVLEICVIKNMNSLRLINCLCRQQQDFFFMPLSKFLENRFQFDPDFRIGVSDLIFDLVLHPIQQLVSEKSSENVDSLLRLVVAQLFAAIRTSSVDVQDLLIERLVDKMPMRNLLSSILINGVIDKNLRSLCLLRLLTLAANRHPPRDVITARGYLLSVEQLLTQIPERTVQPLRLSETISTNIQPMEVDEYCESDLESDVTATRYIIVELCSNNTADIVRLALSHGVSEVDNVLVALCRLLHTLMVRIGLPATQLLPLLTACGHAPGLLPKLWELLASLRGRTLTPLLNSLAHATELTPEELDQVAPLLYSWSTLMRSCLLSLHDRDFFAGAAGPLPELEKISSALLDAMLGLIELAHPTTRPAVMGEDYKRALEGLGTPRHDWTAGGQADNDNLRQQLFVWSALFGSIQTCVTQLRARHLRKTNKFCKSENHWLRPSWVDSMKLMSPNTRGGHAEWFWRGSVSLQRVPFGYYSVLNPDREIDPENPVLLSTTESRQLAVLTEMPFVMDFRRRVDLFYSLVRANRYSMQGTRDTMHNFNSLKIKVRRSHLYDDAFEKLSLSNEPDIRPRLRIEFVNEYELLEAGVDGGGLAREFLAELLKTGFDPNRGLFIDAGELRGLFPNPAYRALGVSLEHFYFLGRMLAKSIYEGQLVELPLADFFMAKILSRSGGDVDIDYLENLDSQLYKNLLILKDMKSEEEVEELNIDFNVSTDFVGQLETIDLRPNGGSEAVTMSNRVEYIHLMADFKLNVQLRQQCKAFVDGMNQVVPIDWLRLFDPHELKILISGADVEVDISDLRKNIHYYGETTEDHETVKQFWAVLEKLSEEDKGKSNESSHIAALLKFVTSCSRPPLFGFKDLQPPFSLQIIPDEDRLPTASTCMNLLKLPDFKNPNKLEERLLQAIHSGAGFELA